MISHLNASLLQYPMYNFSFLFETSIFPQAALFYKFGVPDPADGRKDLLAFLTVLHFPNLFRNL